MHVVLERLPQLADAAAGGCHIGGGSAEIIWSQRGEVQYSTSLPLGAVRLTESFLRQDPPADAELAELSEYIGQQLEKPLARLGRKPQARALGTSATAAAVVWRMARREYTCPRRMIERPP